MTEAEWLACEDPDAMLSALFRVWRRPNRRKLRLFSCACCRHVPAILTAEYVPDIIATVEQFADGLIDNVTLTKTLTGRWRHYTKWSFLSQLTPRYVERLRSQVAALSADGAHERLYQVAILRDLFRPRKFRVGKVAFNPAWRTDTAVSLARTMYDSRDFGAIPILADALQDAGCDSEEVLTHCRDANQPHVRGCWVCDLVLGKA